MKRLALLSLLFVTGITALAQSQFTIGDNLTYAVIKDPDGFVNIHKTPSTQSKVIGKIYDNSVFSCEPNGTNWWKVLKINENDRSDWLEGYIYKDRISLLPDHWYSINKKHIHVDSCVLKTDSTIIAIKRGTFNPQKHKLLYSNRGGGGDYLEKIDGRHVWGTDGDLPRKSITSIKVTKNGIDIIIPRNEFSDLYEPNFETLSICKGPGNTFYIKMDNSDGAGGYTIIWVFKDNKYYGRYIDNSLA